MQPSFFYKSHVALGFYFGLATLLLASLAVASGGAYLHFVALFLFSLLVAYWIFWRLSSSLTHFLLSDLIDADSVWRERAALLILVCAVVFACAHLMRLGGVPVIQGMLEKDYYVVMLVRQFIFHDELHAVWKYGPNILVKSVFPFFVFFYLFRSRVLFAVALIVGGLYAVSLMNKLFVVLLVTPAIIHSLISLRWVAAASLSIVPVLGLAFLVQVQNPHLQSPEVVDIVDSIRAHTSLGLDGARREALLRHFRTQKVEVEVDVGHADAGGLSVVSDTVYRRVFLVPGEVMTAWFANVPARIPYAGGCGYRWLAPLLRCEYVAYSVVINNIEHPELASKGIRGTMTAASFVEDYANFGLLGLVVSGVILAAILTGIGRLFGEAWRANLALNAIPLILLLEIPLSTVILTGGWLITLSLYLLILRPAVFVPNHVT